MRTTLLPAQFTRILCLLRQASARADTRVPSSHTAHLAAGERLDRHTGPGRAGSCCTAANAPPPRRAWGTEGRTHLSTADRRALPVPTTRARSQSRCTAPPEVKAHSDTWRAELRELLPRQPPVTGPPHPFRYRGTAMRADRSVPPPQTYLNAIDRK